MKMKKTFTIVVSVLLICCCIVGGTVAWLTAKTAPITNTFTIGNITITLVETQGASNYKIVPGTEYAKNPTVIVARGSEACWLFVKVAASEHVSEYVEYAIADGWTQLAGDDTVWYRSVASNESEDQSFQVIANDKITIDSNVTKEMADTAISNNYQLSLEITAYAIQSENIADVATAWSELNPVNP